MKLTIDRKTWLRGEGSDYSYLLRTRDNKKCCLGFLANQCGLNDKQISNVDTLGTMLRMESPTVTIDELPDGLRFLIDDPDGWNSGPATTLMDLNDNKEIDDDERERKLTAIFASHGIEAEFV